MSRQNVNIRSVKVPELDIDHMLYKNQPVPPRGKVERRVVANLITRLAKKGFAVTSVWDGEEDAPVKTMKEAMELVFNLDESRIYFGSHSVVIVLGNDGWDCISDWTYSDGDKDGFGKAMDEFIDTVEQYA